MTQLTTKENIQKVESLWVKLKLDFDNEELHQQFTDYCSSHNLLHLAAKKYRTYKDEKGPSSLLDKYLQQITLLAQYKLSPEGKDPQKESPGLMARLLTGPNFLLLFGTFEIIYCIISPRTTLHLLLGLIALLFSGLWSIRNFIQKFPSK